MYTMTYSVDSSSMRFIYTSCLISATQDELSADLLDNARGRVAAAKSTYIK